MFYAPINVKPPGGGGGEAGHGVGISHLKYPKAEPKKGTMKISQNNTLPSLFINVAASPKIHVPVTAAIIHFNHNPCYTAKNTDTFQDKVHIL